MKGIFAFLIVIIFVLPSSGCTKAKFMTHDQIVEALTKIDYKDDVATEADQEEQLRRDNLTPIDKFKPTFSEDVREAVVPLKINDGEFSDLRSKDVPVVNQWNGTCTAHGGVAAMENLLGGKIDLSERDAWSKYAQYSSDAFINALTRPANSICTSKEWPNSHEQPIGECKGKYYISNQRYISGNLQKAIDTLKGSKPVYIAMYVPTEMIKCRKVITAKTGMDYSSGHALSVVGYHMDKRIPSGGYFILKNSWGKICGDNGYQYIDFQVLLNVSPWMWSINAVAEL